jgi:hypothetical protein
MAASIAAAAGGCNAKHAVPASNQRISRTSPLPLPSPSAGGIEAAQIDTVADLGGRAGMLLDASLGRCRRCATNLAPAVAKRDALARAPRSSALRSST